MTAELQATPLQHEGAEAFAVSTKLKQTSLEEPTMTMTTTEDDETENNDDDSDDESDDDEDDDDDDDGSVSDVSESSSDDSSFLGSDDEAAFSVATLDMNASANKRMGGGGGNDNSSVNRSLSSRRSLNLKLSGYSTAAVQNATAAAAGAPPSQQQEAATNKGLRRSKSMPLVEPPTKMEFMGVNTDEMSAADSASLRNLMTRMNSTKSLTYFQDTADSSAGNDPNVPNDVQVVQMTTIDPKKAGRRKTARTLSGRTIPGGKGASSPGGGSVSSAVGLGAATDSPQACLEFILKGVAPPESDYPDSFWESYFEAATEARTAAYTPEVVKAMRSQDLVTLQSIVNDQGSVAMDACNAQGETLLHLACRRRNHDLVQFLLNEAKVPVRVCDDWRKTPLHELCWNSRVGNAAKDNDGGVGTPTKSRSSRGDDDAASNDGSTGTLQSDDNDDKEDQSFDSFLLLVNLAPELLFAKDKRGFPALQYVPKDGWTAWCAFLKSRPVRKQLRTKVQMMGFVRSRDQLKQTLERAHLVVGSLQ